MKAISGNSGGHPLSRTDPWPRRTEPDGTDGGSALDSRPRAPRAIEDIRRHRLSEAAGCLGLGRLACREQEARVSRSLPREERPVFESAAPESCWGTSPAACRTQIVPVVLPTDRSRARELLPTEHRVPSLASADRQPRSSSSDGAELLGLVSDPGWRAWRGSRVIGNANLQRIIPGRAHGQCRARPWIRAMPAEVSFLGEIDVGNVILDAADSR